MRSFAPFIGICILLSACGKSTETANTAPPSNTNAPKATTTATAPAVVSAAGPSLLRLTASVKDEPFNGEAACMVSFAVENLHDKPLAVFSAEFVPTQASTGKALTTATKFAGMTAGAANLPLAPGATGNPWKQNVLGSRCEDVAVRFEGKFFCAFQGQACTAANIQVQQQGLASVVGLGR